MLASYTLEENHPVTLRGIPAALSVEFNSVGGAGFVTLVVAPFGMPAVPHAVLAPGANVPFHSTGGEAFNAQVLSIDATAHTLVVRVDRLNHRSVD
ncbi:MAG TPA: hypothetical protein VHQ90_20560 [Thermoanaerobaculia bacterium]|nr:hypothetical protein [Thermoanaerobaculia bacterium]